MNTRHRVATLFTVGTLAFGAFALHSRSARAQIDPYRASYGVYESVRGGESVLRGEIYREGTDPTRYDEHWVLYPGYVYPSATSGVTLTIRPGLREYRDTADFFARVPFARGSRYVHVANLDTDERPIAQ